MEVVILVEFEIGKIIVDEEVKIGEIIADEEVEIGEVKLDVVKEEVVTSDYEKLNNLPQINEVELMGNKTAKDLRLQEEMQALSNLEIEEILKL